MIKKLRRKVIIITMSLVTVILFTTLCSICIVSYNAQKSELKKILINEVNISRNFEEITSDISLKEPPRRFEIGKPHDDHYSVRPSFTVTVHVDGDGKIKENLSSTAEISEDNLGVAVQKALNSNHNNGQIKSLNLMFLRLKGKDEGEIISFVDTTEMHIYMKNLITTLIIVGLSALIILFFLCIFLARLTVKPVETAWRQQKHFIADASHEIKTPLTVILANTDILMKHPHEYIESQAKWVQYIHDEAEHMKYLVENMLFLAKTDASELSIQYSKINLSDVLWSAILPFESILFEHGFVLQTNIEPDLELYGDASRIQEVITILMDNACKYSSGKATITLTAKKVQDKIKIKVNNTGSFIPKDKAAHLFERFYRADESRDRATGGYGLGLSIAESIIKAHHGKISVSSSNDEGTTFTILL